MIVRRQGTMYDCVSGAMLSLIWRTADETLEVAGFRNPKQLRGKAAEERPYPALADFSDSQAVQNMHPRRRCHCQICHSPGVSAPPQ